MSDLKSENEKLLFKGIEHESTGAWYGLNCWRCGAGNFAYTKEESAASFAARKHKAAWCAIDKGESVLILCPGCNKKFCERASSLIDAVGQLPADDDVSPAQAITDLYQAANDTCTLLGGNSDLHPKFPAHVADLRMSIDVAAKVVMKPLGDGAIQIRRVDDGEKYEIEEIKRRLHWEPESFRGTNGYYAACEACKRKTSPFEHEQTAAEHARGIGYRPGDGDKGLVCKGCAGADDAGDAAPDADPIQSLKDVGDMLIGKTLNTAEAVEDLRKMLSEMNTRGQYVIKPDGSMRIPIKDVIKKIEPTIAKMCELLTSPRPEDMDWAADFCESLYGLRYISWGDFAETIRPNRIKVVAPARKPGRDGFIIGDPPEGSKPGRVWFDAITDDDVEFLAGRDAMLDFACAEGGIEIDLTFNLDDRDEYSISLRSKRFNHIMRAVRKIKTRTDITSLPVEINLDVSHYGLLEDGPAPTDDGGGIPLPKDVGDAMLKALEEGKPIVGDAVQVPQDDASTKSLLAWFQTMVEEERQASMDVVRHTNECIDASRPHDEYIKAVERHSAAIGATDARVANLKNQPFAPYPVPPQALHRIEYLEKTINAANNAIERIAKIRDEQAAAIQTYNQNAVRDEKLRDKLGQENADLRLRVVDLEDALNNPDREAWALRELAHRCRFDGESVFGRCSLCFGTAPKYGTAVDASKAMRQYRWRVLGEGLICPECVKAVEDSKIQALKIPKATHTVDISDEVGNLYSAANECKKLIKRFLLDATENRDSEFEADSLMRLVNLIEGAQDAIKSEEPHSILRVYRNEQEAQS